MYKKKKLAQKKHRKNKVRLKALNGASLLKAKPKKKIVSAPIEVEKKAEVKKPVAEKAPVKKAVAKKTAAVNPNIVFLIIIFLYFIYIYLVLY